MKSPTTAVMALVMLFSNPLLAADLELASPFVDQAVLQREMKVPVWGWSAPGSQITVTFAGQERKTTTTPNGSWRVDLHPLTASAEPQSLTVKEASGASITRNNVLVGEVWLASGQSNMDWIAGKSNVGIVARDVAKNKLPIPGVASDWKGASRMHNKKVAPRIPYAIRGVIWCQGEHNSSDGKIYASKMQALLDGWRKLWNLPNLPFYFTQLQCYGTANSSEVGFADAREAQTLFYKNNPHVGMVVQTDLNPIRPEGIHPFNKLDPGKRLARWALANDYGKKDLAFTGPMVASHQIAGGKVTVKFNQRGPGGGLMVGSKGLEADAKNSPDAFVEPAHETPGQPLKHFCLAGKDRVWLPATAVIEGDQVVVSSPQVPEPVGVQYAYSASPVGSNLYNRAGLPAIPFIIFDGKVLFQEDTKKPQPPPPKHSHSPANSVLEQKPAVTKPRVKWAWKSAVVSNTAPTGMP